MQDTQVPGTIIQEKQKITFSPQEMQHGIYLPNVDGYNSTTIRNTTQGPEHAYLTQIGDLEHALNGTRLSLHRETQNSWKTTKKLLGIRYNTWKQGKDHVHEKEHYGAKILEELRKPQHNSSIELSRNSYVLVHDNEIRLDLELEKRNATTHVRKKIYTTILAPDTIRL